LMAKRVGGRENLGIIDDDYKNYLRTKRTIKMKDGEASAILECLQRMQSKDPNFTYSLKVDADEMLTNIFWADGKMRTS
ncbi:hypothetical protein OFM39_27995, partial [Escherichia coli]|nr:hypothetical protein [Escherichia coli]